MLCAPHDCSTKMSFATGAYSLTLSHALPAGAAKIGFNSSRKVRDRYQGFGNIASMAQRSSGSSPPLQLVQKNERACRETRLLRSRERVPEDLGCQRSEAVSELLTAYRQDENCQSPEWLKQRRIRVGLHVSNSLISSEFTPIGSRRVF